MYCKIRTPSHGQILCEHKLTHTNTHISIQWSVQLYIMYKYKYVCYFVVSNDTSRLFND